MDIDNSIWVKYIIPILIGPVFVCCKTLWDRYSYQHREQEILLKKLSVDKIQHKLQSFYWPIYIRLLKDYELRSKIIYTSNNSIYDSDNENDNDNDENIDELDKNNRCSYVINNKRCANIVPINIKDKYNCFCISHKYMGLLSDIKKVINTTELTNIDIIDSMPHPTSCTSGMTQSTSGTSGGSGMTQSTSGTSGMHESKPCEIKISIHPSPKSYNNSDPIISDNIASSLINLIDLNNAGKVLDKTYSLLNNKLTDSQINAGKKIFKFITTRSMSLSRASTRGIRVQIDKSISDRSIHDPLDLIDVQNPLSTSNIITNSYRELCVNKNVLDKLDIYLIDNHKVVVNIIEHNISTAEPNTNMGRQLMKYLKYVSLLLTLHDGGELKIRPKDLGAAYPKNLLPMIEKHLFILQKEYNTTINSFVIPVSQSFLSWLCGYRYDKMLLKCAKIRCCKKSKCMKNKNA